MSKLIHCIGALALAGASMTVPLAQAATASASLSNVRLRVIDVNLSDGITAAVTLSGGQSNVFASTALGGAPITSVSLYDNGFGSALGPVSRGTGSTNATGALLPGDLLVGVGPGAGSTATATGAGNEASGFANAYSINFSLTANALLVLEADSPSVLANAALGESAYAWVYVGLSSTDDSTFSQSQAYSSIARDGSTSGISPPALQATFVNLTGAAISGTIGFSAYSTASGLLAAPIPEPASTALWLTGLAGLVAWRRREVQRRV